MNVEHSSDPCRLCGATTHRRYEIREMLLGTRHEFTYFQCATCAALQIAEIPSDMTPYYPNHYNFFERENPLLLWLKGQRLAASIFQKRNAGYLITLLKGPSPFAYFLIDIAAYKNRPILDVGCGKGTLLKEMQMAGFQNLTGLDPFLSEKTVSSPTLRFVKKPFFELDGSYDVIMFNHSLEHVPDMKRTLQKAGDLLNTEGRLVVRMPVLGEAWENYRQHWVQLDAPRHFHLLNKTGFEKIAQVAGFEVIKTVFDSSDLQFWGSEQYKADIAMNSERSYSIHPSKSMFTSEQINCFKQKAAQLNEAGQGDSAYFLLKKLPHGPA